MATTTGGHTLSLMACVRESSPPQDTHAHSDHDQPRNETKRRRFHPFRGLRRMFRRKVRHSGTVMPAPGDPPAEPAPVVLDAHRSRSTSELLAGDEPTKRRSGTSLYAGHSGLSVSHDSVFTAEHRSDHSSSEELDTNQSSSSLSIHQIMLPGVKAELFDAVRKRRGGHGRGDTSEDDEDLGLPRSPCNSPTTVDILLEKGIKENMGKSHSTCSDGSLLSMGSSEMDEDSVGGEHSRHSSKVSLHERKLFYDNDSELDLGVYAAPLSHSAARHKMSVRPKRTHGAPRRRRPQQLSTMSPLPTTPEVNEESLGRGSSPERHTPDDFTPELNAINTEPLDNVWLPPDNLITTETQLKSSSLPPGLALSSELPGKLARSRSNASKNTELSAPSYKRNLSTPELERDSSNNVELLARPRELFGVVGEEDEEEERIEEKKKEESFFGRLLSRRSGKKKKEKMEEEESKVKVPEVPVVPKRIDEKGRYANERSYESHGNRSKGGIRARQRVEPINLPPSPEPVRKDSNREFEGNSDAAILSTSPSKDSSVNRMHISYSSSPPKPTWPEGTVHARTPTETKIVDYVAKSKDEEPELKPKLRIGGLTSYQQKVSSINDYDERDYSSLIHTSSIDTNLKHNSMLKKSKSFRDNADLPLMEKEVVPHLTTGFGDYFQYRHNETRNIGGFNSIVTPDSLEVNNPSMNTKDSGLESPDMNRDIYRGMFTKNNFINTRSVCKETKIRQDFVLKKSSSLESVSSIEASPSPIRSTMKSSSTESVSSLTRQTTTSPTTSGGTNITQQDEYAKKTDVTNHCFMEETNKFAAVLRPVAVSKPIEISKDFSSRSPLTSEGSCITPVDESVLRSQPLKREARLSQVITPGTAVPEFLRVQLNPVESKPISNIVLSTSAKTEADKLETSKPHEMPKPRNILNSQTENKVTAAESVELIVPKKKSDEPQVSLLGLRIKKSSREELSPTGDKFRVEEPFEGTENGVARSQDKVQKPFEDKVDQIPIPKPRNVSLQAPLSPVNKYMGISANNTPNRQFIKKGSVTNMEEGCQKEVKRQLSNDNIKIVEKDISKEVTSMRKSVLSESDVTEKVNGEIDSGDYPDVVLRKKHSLRDSGSRTDEDKRTSGEESPDVTLRKKSRDFTQRKEEEPELLKVFARRSLKIKDTDTEVVGQQVAKKEAQESEQASKSRDSDKENEGDSPKEERKKPLSKEPLVELKRVETEPMKGTPMTNNTSRGPFKYQRSVSVNSSMPIQVIESNGLNMKENNVGPEKRHRKSTPDAPTIHEKLPHRWANINKDIEIDVTNTEVKKPPIDAKPALVSEEDAPKFKRIQQRKEEWEQRAQQAAKKSLP